jgi:hypothetical protein
MVPAMTARDEKIAPAGEPAVGQTSRAVARRRSAGVAGAPRGPVKQPAPDGAGAAT